MVSTLLAINLASLLEALEERTRIKLPTTVIEVSLAEGVLHIRFSHPKTREADVEPLPLKTPAFIFRDEETGEITALEILDLGEALRELGMKLKGA
ncbi:MAG: hypothetical protein C0200_00055 [Thermoproteota archaeon]|nr:MAG: hypothetical protein C0200_00055 [Candidatus Korarchaeota archaeon]